jgi:hypothetical protein
MNRCIFQSMRVLALAVTALCICAFVPLAAQSNKKSSSPAPKSAPAAKPATGGATHGASTTAGHSGPTTSGRSGPMASGHTGPTTSNPSGRTTTTTTTANRGVTANRTTAGAAGGVHNESRPGAANRTATGGVAPRGSRTVETRNGAVTRRADGRVSDVHDARRGMDIHHGLDGGRRVSVERADHSRLVAERGRRGYIERRYAFHGHDYARRSYYWHGREYPRYYRGYYYHGAFVNVYAPAVYYPPAFYGWAYNPWVTPVAFGWGWAGNPWYGYYGFYFAPYPVYAGPAFWLTDYLISQELQAAYAAQQEAAVQAAAANAAAGQALLTEAIKAQIADEVKAQIALENAEAQQNTQGQDPDPGSSGIARMLGDGRPHVFVAGNALDVTDSNGAECALSDGDVLQFSGPAPADNQTDVSLVVVASKGGNECQHAATVTVAVADLQEMQNHMRETIDQGMQELQSKQGQGGLPAAPASAKAVPVQTAFAQNAPPPEQNGAADINQQLAQADQVDQQAAQDSSAAGADAAAAPPPPSAPAQTVNIALGQSIDQVTTALGQPVTVIDLGPKKIYKYKDMKITFKDGKVSDVE